MFAQVPIMMRFDGLFTVEVGNGAVHLQDLVVGPPGDLREVALDLNGRVVALAFGVGEVSARALLREMGLESVAR